MHQHIPGFPTIHLYLKISHLIFQIHIWDNFVEMQNLHSKKPVSSLQAGAVAAQSYVTCDWYQSVFCDQALSSSQKHTHEYVGLKKWDLSVPILFSPLVSPGWPDTAGSCRASLIALHKMEQLQFSFRTELMTGGCPRCARTRGNTQKVEDLGRNPPSSPPWEGWEPPFPSWQPECQAWDSLFSLSPEKVIPLSRREIKIPWAKERNRNLAWRTWSLVPHLTLLKQLYMKSLCESSCEYSRKMLYYRDYIFFLTYLRSIRMTSLYIGSSVSQRNL